MAKNSVTGWTKETVAEKRRRYKEWKNAGAPPFEENYCLAKIPRQPDDYDGPPRYCGSGKVEKHGSNYLCKHHCGATEVREDNLEKLAGMKHGMHALRQHVRQDFDDKDRALYDWIIDEYPEAYGISIEESPADAYDLHRLAVEIVRAERGRGHLLQEGEVHEEEVYGDEGVVVDENGDIVTQKSEHYLAKMMARQDSKISDLQKELGITRKERMRRSDTQDAVEAVKGFAELGSAFINRDEKDYDPDEQPWEEDED